MGSVDRYVSADFDIIIVGAGLGGINAGYRVQTELPAFSYSIFESRDAIGGTWDLFRYPGIRSDSDLHTFGFQWRPWDKPNIIADGESIRTYINESAAEYGIDRKVQFHHKLISADWSSKEQIWRLLVDANGEKQVFKARFVILSTGYYNFDEPLDTYIPGIENFKGAVIHPQFWPEGFDYANKRIVIIGSGATAITLLPNLAKTAAHVTMLQRSPSYVLPLPSISPIDNAFRFLFPRWIVSRLLRWKNLVLPYIFFQFCRAFPNAARKAIRKAAKEFLPASVPYEPTFNPTYNPWEQRLCVCPDGDFFKALHRENADIVTDKIKNITAASIETISGKTIEADVIVTATGLKLHLVGGTKITVDGKDLSVSQKYMWKGMMLQDVPNAAVVFGYTNASWTLGADHTAQTFCRLLKYMERRGMSSAVARVRDVEKLGKRSFLNLNSTYIEKASGALPVGGNVAPWKPRADYLADYWSAKFGSLVNDLEFVKKEKAD